MRKHMLIPVLAVSLVMAACGDDDSGAATTTAETAAPSVSTTEPSVTTESVMTTVARESATSQPVAPIPDELPISEIETDVGGVTGRFFQVRVHNSSQDEVELAVPCGLLLLPPEGSDMQRMMIVEEASATVPGNGDAVVEPFVVCIDSHLAEAAAGAVYELGPMAEGDLLVLAECLCDRDIDEIVGESFFGGLNVQLAVWTVADGRSMQLADVLDDVDEASSDLLGEGFDLESFPSPEELGDLSGIDEELASTLQFLAESQAVAEEVIVQCGIELPDA